MNHKVKSLFFSQYLGQEAIWYNGRQDAGHDVSYLTLNGLMDEDYLLLRDISQLEDFERFIIAKIMGLEGNLSLNDRRDVVTDKDSSIVSLDGVLSDCSIWNGEEYDSYWSADLSFEACQYMQRIGILLPLTFINENNQPETYSEQKLIDLGWVKLQSNEQ